MGLGMTFFKIRKQLLHRRSSSCFSPLYTILMAPVHVIFRLLELETHFPSKDLEITRDDNSSV